MKSRLVKRATAFALNVTIFACAATWIVWAQVVGGGTVLGCVAPNGLIRSVDEATGTCRPGDVTLSWYTKAGADAAFLGKAAQAADADRLDGLDSGQFLRDGDEAGGALGGAYPNPSIAAGAVGTAALEDGAVTAEKLAPGLGLGGPVAVDANNKVVGSFLDVHLGDYEETNFTVTDGTADVLVRVGDDSFIVHLRRWGFDEPLLVYYLQPGCTGTPYTSHVFKTGADDGLVPVAEGLTELTAWVPDFSVPQVVTYPEQPLSWKAPPFRENCPQCTPPTCYEARATGGDKLTVLRQFAFGRSQFTGPFRVR